MSVGPPCGTCLCHPPGASKFYVPNTVWKICAPLTLAALFSVRPDLRNNRIKITLRNKQLTADAYDHVL